MNIQDMRDKDILVRQYGSSASLDIRKNFHKKYSTGPMEYTAWILSHVRFFAGCRVLEVGCGTGSLWENSARLVDTFSALVLTDLSAGMIDLAKQAYAGRKNVQAQVMDVLDVPFAPGSFDIIIANSMLYHVTDVHTALENMRCLLRDGGQFYATTFGKNGLNQYIQHAMTEMGLVDVKNSGEISFTLENGGELLRGHFSALREGKFDDCLSGVEPADLVDYIFSMASMSHVDRSQRDRMLAYFDSEKERLGSLNIPKPYGLFICDK